MYLQICDYTYVYTYKGLGSKKDSERRELSQSRERKILFFFIWYIIIFFVDIT